MPTRGTDRQSALDSFTTSVSGDFFSIAGLVKTIIFWIGSGADSSRTNGLVKLTAGIF